jgi:hypothetical protein
METLRARIYRQSAPTAKPIPFRIAAVFHKKGGKTGNPSKSPIGILAREAKTPTA